MQTAMCKCKKPPRSFLVSCHKNEKYCLKYPIETLLWKPIELMMCGSCREMLFLILTSKHRICTFAKMYIVNNKLFLSNCTDIFFIDAYSPMSSYFLNACFPGLLSKLNFLIAQKVWLKCLKILLHF